jgi:hypothetical protein
VPRSWRPPGRIFVFPIVLTALTGSRQAPSRILIFLIVLIVLIVLEVLEVLEVLNVLNVLIVLVVLTGS